jgi:hypothetical protein
LKLGKRRIWEAGFTEKIFEFPVINEVIDIDDQIAGR